MRICEEECWSGSREGPPQSWLLNYINKTQEEMEIRRGDPVCLYGHVHLCKYHTSA